MHSLELNYDDKANEFRKMCAEKKLFRLVEITSTGNQMQDVFSGSLI